MRQVQIGKVKKIHVRGFITHTYKVYDLHQHLPHFPIRRFIPISLGYILITAGLLLGNMSTAIQNQLSVSASTEYTGYTNARILSLQDESSLLATQDFRVSSRANGVDKRVYVLDEYFKLRNSPLYGYAQTFVDACDHFKAPKDCLLVPAIARHETDLCKYYLSAEMRNCMGWGGGGEYRMTFNSFEEHIYIAYDVLVNQYGIRFMQNASLMDTTFCGSEPGCTGWGERIKFFEREIDDFGVSLG